MDLRRRALLAAGGLVIGLATVVLPQLPVVAAPPGLKCTDWADGEAAAMAQAKACSRAVAVKSLTDEMNLVTAQPAGHMRLEQSLAPKRVKRGADWVPIDTGLRQGSDGFLAPLASTLDVKFSGGGKTPLISVTVDGKTASWSWPKALPKPAIDGNSAVYAEVFRGVDLRVTATATGFTQVFVVKNAAAAANPELRRIRYGFTGSGLSAKQNALGTVDIVDTQGRNVLIGGSGHAWDSTDTITLPAKAAASMGLADNVMRGVPSDASTPGDNAKTGKVRVETSADELVTVPDASLLTSSSVKYPLYIDPSLSLDRNRGKTRWAYSNQYGRTNTDEAARVGWSPTSGHGAWRSFFVFDTAELLGKHILGATLHTLLDHSHLCSPQPSYMWLTNPVPAVGDGAPLGWSSGTNVQPSLNVMVAQDSGNANEGNVCTGGNQPDDPMEFTSTALRDHLAWALSVNSTQFNTVLTGRAADGSYENNVDGWKRFFWAQTSLSVDYNTAPTAGAVSSDPSMSCVDGGGSSPSASAAVINDTTPDLRVVTNDVDPGETDLKGEFEVQKWSGSAWVAATTMTDSVTRSNGGTSSVTLPVLVKNTQYRWHARVRDPWTYGVDSGTDLSGYTGWCEFKVDGDPPTVSVSAPEYPKDCAPCGGIGTTGRFTITTPHTDVVKFYWGFSYPPSNVITTSGGAARSFDWTPSTGGYRTLYVRAEDGAVNTGDASYAFTVDGADPLRARWRLVDQPDEDTGVITPVDSGPNGFTATVQGGATVGNGRFPGATGISFDGSDDQIATSGPVIADTSRSFAVTAWVKLGSKTSGSHKIISQDGPSGGTGFMLEYVPGSYDLWKITAPNQSGGSTPGAQSATGAPKIGQWTHLAASYDSAAKTLKLYVNGVLAHTATGITTWNANGPFRIGQGFHGTISDVKVWQRILYDGEIKDMTDPLGEARVGEYHFGETDSAYANDSSGKGHRLYLTGGATIPSSGAGYDLTGLLLFDGTGKAEATSPSLYTSQSFTVSAWVRLDGTQLPTQSRIAVSQNGTNVSGFYLGYSYGSGVGKWSFYLPGADVAGGGNGLTVQSAALTNAVMGQWTNLQGTYDATTNAVKLYANGLLVGQGTRASAMFDTSGGLVVGAAKWTPTGGSTAVSDYWKGAIDEVKVYAGVVPLTLGDWRFDSCTGTPVVCADAASPAHPVTLSGDATWTPTGQGESSGMAMNGTGYATTASSIVDTSKSFTVSAWVNPTSTPSTMCAVCFEGTRADSFVLGYRAGHGWMFWGHSSDTDTSGEASAKSTAPVELNKWTHLTGQYDAVLGEIRLYVDGVHAATTKYTAGWNGSGPMVIGREKWQGNPVSYWRGTIDDVRVYAGVVSSPAAIIEPRPPAPETPPPPPGVPPTRAGDWAFNETTGTTAADTSGGSHTLTVNGGTWTASGHDGGALSFANSGEAKTAGPVLNTNESFTVEAWVKPTAVGGAKCILSQWAANHWGFRIGVGDSGKWHFYMLDQDGQPTSHLAEATSSPQAGVWTRLTAVYDHQAGTMKFYINGVLEATTSHTSTWNATGPLVVGADQWWGGTYERWNGAVDELRVWQRALTSSEINP